MKSSREPAMPSKIPRPSPAGDPDPPESLGPSPCDAFRPRTMLRVCAARAVPAASLYRRCDPASIPFETTAQAAGSEDFVGQDRAVEAVRFGIEIQREGYNLFA